MVDVAERVCVRLQKHTRHGQASEADPGEQAHDGQRPRHHRNPVNRLEDVQARPVHPPERPDQRVEHGERVVHEVGQGRLTGQHGFVIRAEESQELEARDEDPAHRQVHERRR